jgi:hypothetical protein
MGLQSLALIESPTVLRAFLIFSSFDKFLDLWYY